LYKFGGPPPEIEAFPRTGSFKTIHYLSQSSVCIITAIAIDCNPAAQHQKCCVKKNSFQRPRLKKKTAKEINKKPLNIYEEICMQAFPRWLHSIMITSPHNNKRVARRGFLLRCKIKIYANVCIRSHIRR